MDTHQDTASSLPAGKCPLVGRRQGGKARPASAPRRTRGVGRGLASREAQSAERVGLDRNAALTRAHALRSLDRGTAAKAYTEGWDGNPQEYSIGAPPSLFRSEAQSEMRRRHHKAFLADCGAVWAGTMTDAQMDARRAVRRAEYEALTAKECARADR